MFSLICFTSTLEFKMKFKLFHWSFNCSFKLFWHFLPCLFTFFYLHLFKNYVKLLLNFVCRNWPDVEEHCSYELRKEKFDKIIFNPLNWRQFACIAERTVLVWNVEKVNETFHLQKSYVFPLNGLCLPWIEKLNVIVLWQKRLWREFSYI